MLVSEGDGGLEEYIDGPIGTMHSCVRPQTRLTFAQRRQSGVTSPGSEVCAVRTVEIKPGTAEQNVLKLINSTWIESQVPIYNTPHLHLFPSSLPGVHPRL